MVIKEITAQEFIENYNDNNFEVIDIRERDEFDLVHISESKLIPMKEVMSRLDEIDFSKKVIIVCRTGSRSRFVCSWFEKEGKQVYNLSNGILALKQAEFDKLKIKDEDLANIYLK